VVRIVSASDPNPNYVDMEKSFYIYADVDNSNPIVCGCRLGYGVSDIQQIWIIR
jgi:hypothetical protein